MPGHHDGRWVDLRLFARPVDSSNRVRQSVTEAVTPIVASTVADTSPVAAECSHSYLSYGVHHWGESRSVAPGAGTMRTAAIGRSATGSATVSAILLLCREGQSQVRQRSVITASAARRRHRLRQEGAGDQAATAPVARLLGDSGHHQSADLP